MRDPLGIFEAAAARGLVTFPPGWYGWKGPKRTAHAASVLETALAKGPEPLRSLVKLFQNRRAGPAPQRPGPRTRQVGPLQPPASGAAAGHPDALRVAFLTPGLLVGGAERWVASLCQHFDRAKVQPVAVLYSEWGHVSPVVERWIPRDVRISSVNAATMRAACEGVDLLISWGHTSLPKLTAGLGIPLVDVQHGTTGFEIQRELAQAGVDAGADLVAVGEACLENFEPEVRQRVTVIENGAEPDRACSRVGRDYYRRQLRISPGAPVVAYVGRFAEVKNLAGLAAAVKELPGAWTLIAAGPHYTMPPELPALGHRVRILESVSSPGEILAAADVFCAPSHHEANSLATIEAMLAGCPVVTTDYPAALALHAQRGDVSKLVPLQPSGEVLAAAITAAYCEGREGARATRARSVAWEHYTAPAMAARWEDYLGRYTRQK